MGVLDLAPASRREFPVSNDRTDGLAMTTTLAIILAAGEGTRMRSARSKLLHDVGNRPMLGHVLAATEVAGIARRAVVVGAHAEAVSDYVTTTDPAATVHEQTERLGTGHAALAAREAIVDGLDHVVVLFGDTPLLRPETLGALLKRLDAGADLVVLGFRPDDPGAYGRLLTRGDRLLAIREFVAASEEERRIGLCNGGIMGFRGRHVLSLLDEIGNDNPKKEYFLTDAVEIANARGLSVAVMEIDPEETLGVNSRADLAAAEAAFQHRMRAAAMAEGATLVAPETVWFSHDTRLGRDVRVEPNVWFGPGVSVGEGASIRANSHLEGATIAAGAAIGPFARVRPGSVVGEDARVGNFVEVKNSNIGAGVKAGHLAYIGDADIGAETNIGAGTITCNYDGYSKHRTIVGERTFIGTNTSLVAPLTIGNDAYVATGGVITMNVPDDDMAIARARQVNKEGWAAKFREKQKRD